MDQKGHEIDQKGLKMYEKGQKRMFGPKIPVFLAEISIAKLRGTNLTEPPPPLSG